MTRYSGPGSIGERDVQGRSGMAGGPLTTQLQNHTPGRPQPLKPPRPPPAWTRHRPRVLPQHGRRLAQPGRSSDRPPPSAPAARRAGGLGPGRHRGEHLGHVGIDQPLTGRSGYRYPVVTVADEMEAAEAVDLD